MARERSAIPLLYKAGQGPVSFEDVPLTPDALSLAIVTLGYAVPPVISG